MKIWKMSMVALIAALMAGQIHAQTQPCPRIERRGDTLFAVPADAQGYRWFKNGTILSGQSQNFVVMEGGGDYSVEAFGISSHFDFAPIVVEPTTSKLSGRVFDPLLQPVEGASVRLGNQTRTTDAQGRYYFEDANVAPGRNVVKIEKGGYFSTQTAVYFTLGAEKTAAVMLHPKEIPVTFHSAHGTLVHNDVFSLRIPENAIARADGTPYDGPVTMHYQHLSPDYPWFGFGMPGGDFLATMTDGETVTLTSYGVLGVELSDADGNTLNLREGSTARIAVRIPDGLQNQPTAALWHFDENEGIWREETPLTVRGKFLTGEASHFSWWNMDYWGPFVGAVWGRIVDCRGNPVAGAPFCINQRCWTTDENGFFRVVRVPAGQNNTLTTNGQTFNFTLNHGDTLDMGELFGGSVLIAAGLLAWSDSNQTAATLTVFTNGGAPPFEYSLDSLTWQNENVFTGLTGLAYTVWIREPNGCVTRIETFLQRAGAGCLLPEDAQPSSYPVYTSWFPALEAHSQGLPIYRYAGCENLELVAANFVCLRELSLSNCGLTALPEGLSNLVGLEALHLFDNPLDTVPSAVFGLPNLRILDMRWTNVPEEDRAGYEANLPGVTIYWDACDEPGAWSCAKRAGGSSYDVGNGVAAHADGSVTVTGYFNGTANFGGITLTSAGYSDAFVARYAANGNVLWAKRAGGLYYDEGYGVAAHADGSVTVTGWFYGTADFDGISLTSEGSSDVFVARYDATGNVLWAKRAGGGGTDDCGLGLAAHADGSVTVTGRFFGTADFDGITFSSVGGRDIFLARYDALGNVLWAKRAGGTNNDEGRGVASHADGSVTVTGRFSGTADFDGITLTSVGFSDAFVARYDAWGNVLWAKRAGGQSAEEMSNGVAAHPGGSVIVTGRFLGTADFGGITLTSAGYSDAFVACYDAAGNVLWAKRAGGISYDEGNSVATHADGSVTVTGYFNGTTDFGGVFLASAGNDDILVARYDAAGNVLGAKRAGGTGSDRGMGVAAHADGSLGLTGRIFETANFGEIILTSTGAENVFVARTCPE